MGQKHAHDGSGKFGRRQGGHSDRQLSGALGRFLDQIRPLCTGPLSKSPRIAAGRRAKGWFGGWEPTRRLQSYETSCLTSEGFPDVVDPAKHPSSDGPHVGETDQIQAALGTPHWCRRLLHGDDGLLCYARPRVILQTLPCASKPHNLECSRCSTVSTSDNRWTSGNVKLDGAYWVW